MVYYITSDLHLGSRHSETELFLKFLKTLPTQDCTLVLNGDTLNRRWTVYSKKENEVLATLADLSNKIRVVWLQGNHDRKLKPEQSGSIEFLPYLAVGTAMILHGHSFDLIMKINRPFVWIFRLSHLILDFFKTESLHVSAFAKRFKFLYTVLRNHVRSNALTFAVKKGFKIIICGHTHYCEDTEVNGIRYINTGSWLERPVHYALLGCDGRISIQQFNVQDAV